MADPMPDERLEWIRKHGEHREDVRDAVAEIDRLRALLKALRVAQEAAEHECATAEDERDELRAELAMMANRIPKCPRCGDEYARVIKLCRRCCGVSGRVTLPSGDTAVVTGAQKRAPKCPACEGSGVDYVLRNGIACESCGGTGAA